MLSPRTDIGMYASAKGRKKKLKELNEKPPERDVNINDIKPDENMDPAAMVIMLSILQFLRKNGEGVSVDPNLKFN